MCYGGHCILRCMAACCSSMVWAQVCTALKACFFASWTTFFWGGSQVDTFAAEKDSTYQIMRAMPRCKHLPRREQLSGTRVSVMPPRTLLCHIKRFSFLLVCEVWFAHKVSESQPDLASFKLCLLGTCHTIVLHCGIRQVEKASFEYGLLTRYLA